MEGITFHCNDVFSKYGFGDGDMLHEWVDRRFNYEMQERYDGNFWQDLLAVILARHVIPALAPAKIPGPSVRIELFRSSHNPMRVVKVDGREWDDRKMAFADDGLPRSPQEAIPNVSMLKGFPFQATVVVPDETILEEALALLEAGRLPFESFAFEPGSQA